jgi:hypothetical protein
LPSFRQQSAHSPNSSRKGFELRSILGIFGVGLSMVLALDFNDLFEKQIQMQLLYSTRS